MPKNRYAAVLSRSALEMGKSGMMIGKQLFLDYFALALNEEGWGYDRIMRLIHRVIELDEEFHGATLAKDNAESDVLREHLDRRLREICKGHDFTPYEERYPDLAKVVY